MNSQGPLELPAPDSGGSDAVAGFVYQARVTLPYVVLLGLEDDIDLVVCEHFEDVAILHASGTWTFAQIKSRNPGQGPWTLAQVCRSSGGAFRSLLTTHRSVRERGFPYRLGAWLEGPISIRDALYKISRGEPLADSELTTMADRLESDETECREFLDHVHVKEQRLHDAISSTNMRILGSHRDSLTYKEIEEINSDLERRILEAMSAELSVEDWISLDPPGLRDRMGTKIITKESLGPVIARLGKPIRALLRRVADPDLPLPTRMVEKLLAGGADETVISIAARRRADAQLQIKSHLAATMWQGHSQDELEDVEERILTLMAGLHARYKDEPSPAGAMFDDAMRQLTSVPDQFDPGRVLRMDPFLLVGLAADLSDRCQFHWGLQNA